MNESGKEGGNSERTVPEEISREKGAPAGGSMFSRNLELKVTPGAFSRPPNPPAAAGAGMDAGERGTCFQLEARRVVNILEEEFARLEESGINSGLLDDLLTTWEALWGADDQPPVREFNSLLRTVCASMAAAGGAGRGLRQSEREIIWESIQTMFALALGGEKPGLPERCRAALDKCRALAAGLSGRPEPLAARPPEPSEEDAGRPRADLLLPELETVNAGKDLPEDISLAVDEWFSQVSHLVVQGGPGECAGAGEKAGDKFQAAAEKQSGPPQPRDSVPAPETGAAEDQTGIVQSAPGGLPEETVGGERPAGEEWPAGGGIGSAGPGEVLLPREAPLEESLSLVDAYFAENCRLTVEMIKKNLPRLAGPSPWKTSRMLSGYVDRINALAWDFGLENMDRLFVRISGHLERLSSSAKGEQLSRTEAVERLHSDLAELEQEVGQLVSSG